jgi:hypothetical protein
MNRIGRSIAAFTAAALVALPGAARAQDKDPLIGDWDVTVSVMGQQLPLVLHIEQGEDGLTGTFDSPAQGAYGIPILAISHEHPKVRIELETGAASAILDGTHADGKVTGDFSQGPATGTFEMTKQEPKAEPSGEAKEPGR